MAWRRPKAMLREMYDLTSAIGICFSSEANAEAAGDAHADNPAARWQESRDRGQVGILRANGKAYCVSLNAGPSDKSGRLVCPGAGDDDAYHHTSQVVPWRRPSFLRLSTSPPGSRCLAGRLCTLVCSKVLLASDFRHQVFASLLLPDGALFVFGNQQRVCEGVAASFLFCLAPRKSSC